MQPGRPVIWSVAQHTNHWATAFLKHTKFTLNYSCPGNLTQGMNIYYSLIFNMYRHMPFFLSFAAQNSSADTRELNSSNLDLPTMDKEGSPPSPPSSPLSNFSGLSPGVSPSGVSITSSFGDAEIDLDEINPSLPNNPISMVTSVNYLLSFICVCVASV